MKVIKAILKGFEYAARAMFGYWVIALVVTGCGTKTPTEDLIGKANFAFVTGANHWEAPAGGATWNTIKWSFTPDGYNEMLYTGGADDYTERWSFKFVGNKMTVCAVWNSQIGDIPADVEVTCGGEVFTKCITTTVTITKDYLEETCPNGATTRYDAK